ncbi:MAG: SpoIIIAH-like family protein [Roseburia sp.]|nr:SpoIIIAH-like family protein [Roseburia sp.]
MKKLLRKNQIIITALVVMVALAGYLSLTDDSELAVGVLNQQDMENVAENASDDTAPGDAETENQTAESVSQAAVTDDAAGSEVADDAVTDISDEDIASKENAGEAVLVNNTVTGDYFEAAKLSREQTRAKNKETLLELVNSDSASEVQKEKAMNEIVAMTAVNEKETATENLLAAKGFQDVVVTIVEDSVDVIVNAESLTEQQIAQIEDVVKRKSECASDKIVISPVGKKG